MTITNRNGNKCLSIVMSDKLSACGFWQFLVESGKDAELSGREIVVNASAMSQQEWVACCDLCRSAELFNNTLFI